MIYLLDENQQLIEIVGQDKTLNLLYEREINSLYEIKAEFPLHYENENGTHSYKEAIEKSYFIGHYDKNGRFQVHKIISSDFENSKAYIGGIHIFFDELKAKGVVLGRSYVDKEAKDVAKEFSEVGWHLNHFDTTKPRSFDVEEVSYLSLLYKMVEVYGIDFDFSIDFDGQKIISKKLNIFNELGDETTKRYHYGSNILSIKGEEDFSEIYTSVIAYGKEETDSETEEKTVVTLEDVILEPSDENAYLTKKGSLELIDTVATSVFGYIENEEVSPRVAVVKFSDAETEEQLLEQSKEWLQENNTPKTVFTLDVIDNDDIDLGDIAHVLYDEIGLYKKVKVSKVYDNLATGIRVVEFGDTEYFENSKSEKSLNDSINSTNKKVEQVNDRYAKIINNLKEDFDKRFEEDFKAALDEFEQAKINALAKVEEMEARFDAKFEQEIADFNEKLKELVDKAYQLSDEEIARITNELKTEFDGIRGEMQERLGAFENEDEKIWNKIDDILGEIPSLTEDEKIADDIKKEIEDLKSEIDDIHARPEREREKIREKISEEEQRLSDLREEIERIIDERNKDYRKEIAEKERELEEFKQTVAERIDLDKKAKQEEIERAEAEYEKFKREYEENIGKRKAEYELLIAEYKERSGQFVELINNERNEHVERLRGEITNNEQEIAELEEAIEELKRRAIENKTNEYNLQIEELTAERDELIAEQSQRKKEIERLESKIKEIENELNAGFEKELAEWQSQLDELVSRKEIAEQKVNDREQELQSEYETELSRFKERISELQSQIETLKVRQSKGEKTFYKEVPYDAIEKTVVRTNSSKEGRYHFKPKFLPKPNVNYLVRYTSTGTTLVGVRQIIDDDNQKYLDGSHDKDGELSINVENSGEVYLYVYNNSLRTIHDIKILEETNIDTLIQELQSELDELKNNLHDEPIFEVEQSLIDELERVKQLIEEHNSNKPERPVNDEIDRLRSQIAELKSLDTTDKINELNDNIERVKQSLETVEEDTLRDLTFEETEQIEQLNQSITGLNEHIEELLSWQLLTYEDTPNAVKLNDREKYLSGYDDILDIYNHLVELTNKLSDGLTDEENKHLEELQSVIERLNEELNNIAINDKEQSQLDSIQARIDELNRLIESRPLLQSEIEQIQALNALISQLNRKLGNVSDNPTPEEQQILDGLNSQIGGLNSDLFEVQKRINPLIEDVYNIENILTEVKRTQDGEIRKLAETKQDIDKYSRRLASVETTQEKEVARVGTIEHSVNGISGQFKELTDDLNNPNNPVLKQLDIKAGYDGFYVRNTKVMDGQTMAGYLMATHNQVSAGIKNALTENDVTINNNGIKIGSKSLTGSQMASSIVVSPYAIDLISKNVNIDGNLNVLGTIKAEAAKVAKAEIGEAYISKLTSNVVDTHHLKADSVTANKLKVDTAMANKLIANYTISNHIETKSIDAVKGQFGSLFAQYIKSAVIEADQLKAGTALFDKVFSSDAMIRRLTSQSAFISNIKAIDIDLNRATVTGGDGTNYIRMTNQTVMSYGTFTRSWGGETDTANLELGLYDGQMRMRNLDTGYRLYLTERGLSTSMEGAIDEFTSGTLEFHSRRFNENSRGVTMHSSYGAVAMVSDYSTAVIRSNLTANIESNEYSVYIRPYRLTRGGINDFRFWVKDGADASGTDGVLSFGNPNVRQASGIRFKKSTSGDPYVWITNGNGDYNTGVLHAMRYEGGSVDVNTFNMQHSYAFSNYGGGDVYMGTGGGEFIVTNNSHWRNGSPVYRDIRFGKWFSMSNERYKRDIKKWNTNVLELYRNDLQLYSYKIRDSENTELDLIEHGIVLRENSNEDEFPVEWRHKDGYNGNEVTFWNTKAIQELAQENDSLKLEIKELNNKLNKIMEMIS